MSLTTPPQRQHGNMLVLGASALVICVLLLAVGINLGFWSYKKVMVADAAEALAKPIFRSQIVDRANTEAMVRDIVTSDLELDRRLHDVRVEYVFSRGSAASGWTQLGRNPNPADDPFNRVEVLVCTTMTDVTGLFTLPEAEGGGPRQICQLGEARIEEPPDCLCTGALSSVLDSLVGALRSLLCIIPLLCGVVEKLNPVLDAGLDAVCNLEATLESAVRFLANLLQEGLSAGDLQKVLDAVDCLLKSVVVTVDTTLVTVLGENAIRIEYD